MNTAREKHDPEWFEWYDAAVFGLAVIVLCFTFAVRIVTVDGHSMEPTLLSGQRVAVQSAFYRPQYGDVVVVDSIFPLWRYAGKARGGCRRRCN